MEEIKGEIVFRHIGNIPQTGEIKGMIVLKTENDDDVTLRINPNTKYESLEEGTVVTVTYEPDIDNEHLLAKQITPDSG